MYFFIIIITYSATERKRFAVKRPYIFVLRKSNRPDKFFTGSETSAPPRGSNRCKSFYEPIRNDAHAAKVTETEVIDINTEEKLVRKAQQGDKDAFVEWIESRKLSLSRAAMAILHDEDDTADAVAETVLTAFSKLCSLREPKYAGTWLTRILIFNSYKILRQRSKSVPLDELPETPALSHSSDTVIDIHKSLDALADNDRLILTLYYMDDMSVREIADVLGMNVNTVKTRLARGRERFKKEYNKQEGLCYGTSEQ